MFRLLGSTNFDRLLNKARGVLNLGEYNFFSAGLCLEKLKFPQRCSHFARPPCAVFQTAPESSGRHIIRWYTRVLLSVPRAGPKGRL